MIYELQNNINLLSTGEKSHKLTVAEIPIHSHSIETNATFTITNYLGSSSSGMSSGVSGLGILM